MAALGGPVESVILKGRRFVSDSEESCTITLGGFTNEPKANGNGTLRNVRSRNVGGVEGLKLTCDNAAGDYEYLKELQNSGEFFDAQITLTDGTIYNANVQITDAVALDTKETNCEVKLSGNVEKL